MDADDVQRKLEREERKKKLEEDRLKEERKRQKEKEVNITAHYDHIHDSIN
jgi:hypothetical protein